MKKKHMATILACLVTIVQTSCFSDDSSMGSNSVSDITISGIENAYTMTAFVGEHLKIAPTVESAYAESDLSYEWMLINDKTGTVSAAGDTIQPIILSHDKNLDYEVSLSPGTYQMRFIARSKSNNYTAYQLSTLTVQTEFSQGFYILKETADGNTDIDLLNSKGGFSEDLLKNVNGTAMKGKPLRMSMEYDMCYINTETDAMDKANAIAITTQDKQILLSRTTDMKPIFDKTNLLFDPMDEDEVPYGFLYTQMMGHYYFSTSGLRYSSGPDYEGTLNSGKFSAPISSFKGSEFYVHDIPSYGGVFAWDKESHSLMALDYMGEEGPLTYSNLTGEELTQNLQGFDCLCAGYNLMNRIGTAIFILDNAIAGERYLYQTQSDFNQMYLKSRTKVSPTSHLAKATAFSVNASSAKYVYCVDHNKIYAVVFSSENLDEVEIPVKVGAGETITYVGNQFYYNDFNYLIVGTQQGDNYKVYMYKLIGGAPDGGPVATVAGKGKIKSVKYLRSSFNKNMWQWGLLMYNSYN
ncbi:MAG: PKD-like family lipoprotein [Prevotella sp.]|nr:PKD-like family lipoprotein [Prevotella sp.]MDY4037850.1 PKD-like family lipoprotein [Prevotella sp.]